MKPQRGLVVFAKQVKNLDDENLSESADKPGSVVGNHSSGICITAYLKQPTRIQCEQHLWIPIWPCSRWGLPCHGVLPPMRCALTAPFHPYRPRRTGGILSVALSVGLRPPGVTWHLALWSPDFPPGRNEGGALIRICPAIAWLTRFGG